MDIEFDYQRKRDCINLSKWITAFKWIFILIGIIISIVVKNTIGSQKFDNIIFDNLFELVSIAIFILSIFIFRKSKIEIENTEKEFLKISGSKISWRLTGQKIDLDFNEFLIERGKSTSVVLKTNTGKRYEIDYSEILSLEKRNEFKILVEEKMLGKKGMPGYNFR